MEFENLLKYLHDKIPRFELNYPANWKEQAGWFVGTACSRDHSVSRLQTAPTVGMMVTWSSWINDLNYNINENKYAKHKVINSPTHRSSKFLHCPRNSL
jgi:hypothetical protein